MTSKDTTDKQTSLQLFPGYTEADTAIFAEFENPEARAEPGFLVDFLGSRIRTTSVWKEARALDGQLIPIPVPADFHAEAIEWIGLLKAVRSAAGQYVAMELGAGFGPWSVAGGLAAKLRGIEDIRLCAVEGDSEHFKSLVQHFVDNGFDPDQHALFEAAVGVNAGIAKWPVVENSSEVWGSRPVQAHAGCTNLQLQRTKDIPVIPIRDLLDREPVWDLVHIDVQGDEVDICRSSIDALSARVRRLVVGTHSRKIDGDLLELMSRTGWVLEHEKPTKFTFVPNPATLEAMTTVDGTQVWRNPRLVHAGDYLTSFSHEITSAVRQIRMKAGAMSNLDIIVRNTGTQPWFGGEHAAPVNLSYRWIDSGGSVLPIEGNRASLGRSVVQPGETVRLNLQVLAPPSAGLYTLSISMVQEGVAWFYDRGAEPLTLQVMAD